MNFSDELKAHQSRLKISQERLAEILDDYLIETTLGTVFETPEP